MVIQEIDLLLIKKIYPIGIHGIEHSFRVFLLIKKLCDLESITKLERLQLEFCALFHDIGRVNDLIDDTHGVKSIEKLEEHSFLGFKRFNNSLVRYIIENHCLADKIAIDNSSNYELDDVERSRFLLLLFKDADGLDRFRLGDFDQKYLRYSNSKTLIDFARYNNDRSFLRDEIYENIYSWGRNKI
ncbi:HD domain-containing protein [Tenacibaculum agarivorans]|uniref:HD domain-containing protein n=1 Tax=Tenacibaculum agarivorans TaxID=1908389 RepID=UPI00094BA08E|nr:HD domain-containing protein [Tenacibaculum agarivorans]